MLAALGLLESFRPHLQPCPVIAAELCGGRLLGADFGRFSPPLRHLPAIVLGHQLQEHLLAAARAGGVEVRFGHRVVAVSAAGDAAVLRLADGARERVGLVLACDAAGSPTRASLWPPARRRRLRRAYLRGVADIGWQPPRVRALRYPTAGSSGRHRVDAGRRPSTVACRRGSLVGRLRPDAPAIPGAVQDWRRVNYERPLEVQAWRWSRTPVFLVGDAAHAMTLYLGQGANSALVDALLLSWLLERALHGRGDLAAVGRRYKEIRGRFIRPLQAGSRRQGDLATLGWAPASRLRSQCPSAWLGSAGQQASDQPRVAAKRVRSTAGIGWSLKALRKARWKQAPSSIAAAVSGSTEARMRPSSRSARR
jgi:2-polyprenyl-6-methoxyphenol hydroxylase-like FAD-dependent oxidoreductase